jgi:ketosteroid isomerase-like protein
MVVKLDEGKIVEIHEYFNHLDFVSQLGVSM